jgi:iron uptake system component EfeO
MSTSTSIRPNHRRVRTRLIGAALVMSAAVAACGSSADTAAKTSTSGTKDAVRLVKITITDDGCTPASLKVPAGPATFEVTNTGSGAVTEMELLKGTEILGEVEDVAPGLTGVFSLTLKPGSYVTNCPGGNGSGKGTLVVTGSSSTTELAAGATAAVANYRTYIEQQTENLLTTTKPFVAAVEAGDIAKAKALYTAARPYYETVEPVAESFGDLDPLIDARAGDPLPAGAKWGGFHRIEKALWQDNTTAGMTPVAQELLANVTTLRDKVKTVSLEPATIANGAVDLLNEVSKSKITGEEERYSHIDLVDFRANVDGAEAAFAAVKPMLTARQAALAAELTRRFTDVDTALAAYKGGPGAYNYESYKKLTPADTRKLSAAVDALAEPLSQVAKVVVQ